MNRLILIGNGFDLAHGLKTSYADFIYWYWKSRILNSYEVRSNEWNDGLCKLTYLQGPWSELMFYHQFELKAASGKEIFEWLVENKDVFKVESSPLFERILESIETMGWVDIENEYYSLLILLHGHVKDNYRNHNKQLEMLRDKMIEYLDKENNKCVDIIAEIDEKIHRTITKKEIAVSSSIYSDVKIDEEIHPESTMLLSFNYTHTPRLYESNGLNIRVNYIHGRLEEPKSIIFGYGDELDQGYKKLQEQKDSECLRHIKSIRYLESDNYRRLLSFIESEPYQIVIMGHSCGNSDRTLLNTLFEHRNCVSIKPYYYVKKDGTDNYLELVQNTSRNFTDMKLMRDRVVNKEYCEPLTNRNNN